MKLVTLTAYDSGGRIYVRSDVITSICDLPALNHNGQEVGKRTCVEFSPNGCVLVTETADEIHHQLTQPVVGELFDAPVQGDD